MARRWRRRRRRMPPYRSSRRPPEIGSGCKLDRGSSNRRWRARIGSCCRPCRRRRLGTYPLCPSSRHERLCACRHHPLRPGEMREDDGGSESSPWALCCARVPSRQHRRCQSSSEARRPWLGLNNNVAGAGEKAKMRRKWSVL